MDRREAILRKEVCSDCIWEESRHLVNTPFDQVFNAMDENGKQMCLDLLEYMAKNNVDCLNGGIGDPVVKKSFYFKGEWIDKETLFENFL